MTTALAASLATALVTAGSVTPAAAVDAIDLGDEWPLPNQDYRNTRAVPEPTIDSSNVGTLELAWSMPIPGQGPFGAAAGGPIVHEGVVYFQDLGANVFAIVLEDGDVVWEQRFDSPLVGPTGPAIGGSRVFVSFDDATFGALDIVTGEEQWSVTPELGFLGSIQPLVYEDTVYYATQAGKSGEAGYAAGQSGVIHAADVASGEDRWTFQVVEEGFWGNPEVNAGGGVWYPPAVNEEDGVTYWGTGNPAPFPGTEEFPNGSSRPGPNLYTSSVVALAHDDGELLWHYQAVEHDLFDHDFQVPPILAELEIDGEPRDVLIGSGKVGDVVAIDRETHEAIWRTEVGRHHNDDLDELPEGEEVEVYPGILGGVETPMAYADGMVYVPVVNIPTTHTATGHGAADGTEALDNANADTPVDEGTGELVAIDAGTGEIAWQRDFDSPVFAGATVSGDLVFTATYAGVIHALDRSSGESLWTYEAPAGINAWPAIALDTIVWAAGAGDDPQLLALRIDSGAGEDAAGQDAAGETADTAGQDAADDQDATDDGDAATAAADETWPPPGPHPDTEQVDPPAGVVPGPQFTEPERAEPPEDPVPPVVMPAPSDASPQPTAGPPAAVTPAPDGMSPAPAPSPTSASPTPAPGAEVVELALEARNTSFNRDELTVPAGATVRLTLTNEDRIPHNFAVYRSEAAEEQFFSGQTFTGPGVSIIYEFQAPSEPGEYYFRCDIHPRMMNGAFFVD